MISEKIKAIMKIKKISNIQLAEYLGMSPQALSNKFYRDSYSVQDLINILDFLDCKLIIEPKPDNQVILSMDDLKRDK